MSDRIGGKCDVDECVICGVSAGRCDGPCRACDLFAFLFGDFAEETRCLDVCPCITCDTRRYVLREHAQRHGGGATRRLQGES